MLTDTVVKAASARAKQWKLSDEKGLYLLVHPNGSKYWRLAYRFDGKQKTLALGVYPQQSLKVARQKRDEARLKISQGIDPSASKKRQKQEEAREQHGIFSSGAERWFKKRVLGLSQSQQKQIQRLLSRDILPVLGDRQLDEIKRRDLVSVVGVVEKRGVVLAKNAANVLNGIFQLAQDEGLIELNPAQRLRAVLSVHKPEHFSAATTPGELAEVIRKVDAHSKRPPLGVAVQILARLLCRPGELVQMKWADINFLNATWLCRHTKTNTETIVPLSRQVLGLLENLKATSGQSEWVFSAGRGDGTRHVGAGLLTASLRSAGVSPEQQTCHGFRASGRTILDEVLGYRVDWIEHQLGHSVRDANGRAYNRTSHLEGRREMMQAWSDYLDNLRDGSP
jgi:integrase